MQMPREISQRERNFYYSDGGLKPVVHGARASCKVKNKCNEAVASYSDSSLPDQARLTLALKRDGGVGGRCERGRGCLLSFLSLRSFPFPFPFLFFSFFFFCGGLLVCARDRRKVNVQIARILRN